MTPTVSISKNRERKTQHASQTVMGFYPKLIKALHRRKAAQRGSCETPLLVDAEPAMNLVASIDEALKTLAPYSHLSPVDGLVASLVERRNEFVASVNYYENDIKRTA